MADRDPARTVVELQDFELTLRKLFVEGYIAVAPSDWSADPAASRDRGAVGDPADRGNDDEGKMLTHVVFDELREVNELRYSDKVHVLFRATDKDACLSSIKRIGEVVQDCLARVRADFAPSDLYLALEVMDMKQWHIGAEAKRASLFMKARRLCESLAITYTQEKWKAAILFVEKERRRRSDRELVDNRLVWADAFAASQRQNPSPLADFEQLVAFYVALTDGTGNIERYLGAHASFLKHHEGQVSDESDMCEVCLEIAKEGPQAEEALFTKDKQHPGVLLLTDFSRRCAVLWRSLHGRRFACYKQRKDTGTKLAGTKLAERLKGSHKAVGMMQKRATRRLMGMAQEDDRALAASREPLTRRTLWGSDRRRFMQRVQTANPSTTSKALRDFRKTTEATKKKKSQGNWQGFSAKPPPLRPKLGDRSSVPMVGVPTTLSLSSAASQKALRSRLASIAVRRHAAEPPQKQARVSIDSQVELYTQKLNGDSLLMWLDVIALGLATKSRSAASSTSGMGRSFHVPAMQNAAKLHFSAEFARKHPRIVRQCRAITKRSKSKWTVVESAGAGVHAISNLHSFQEFLKQMRRLRTVAGVAASYFEPAASQVSESLGARRALWKPLRPRRA